MLYKIPKIKIENLEISKIICGSNPFNGISHYTKIRDIKYKRRFNKNQKISDIMIYLVQNYGINAILSSPRLRMRDAIRTTEKETGEKFHWICTPSTRRTVPGIEPEIHAQIDWCAEQGVSICMPHRNFTDENLDQESLVIKDAPEVLAYIRDKGMMTGFSCHYHKVLDAVEKNNYDVPLIIQPLNKIGFESDTDPKHLISKIQSSTKQFINIKPMAAGRLSPKEGNEFCLNNIKEQDFLCPGFDTFEHAVEDMEIIANWFKSR